MIPTYWCVALLASVPVVGAGAVALAGIVGSKHDFGGPTGGDICLPCHTPHMPAAVAPVWEPGPSGRAPFKLYATRRGGPGRTTLLCLGCHDGGVAPDIFDKRHGRRFASQFAGSTVLPGRGTDHPIGVPYPQFDPSFAPVVSLEADPVVKLPDGKVECISCHEPHNRGGHPKLLVRSNRRSALCLSCHQK